MIERIIYKRAEYHYRKYCEYLESHLNDTNIKMIPKRVLRHGRRSLKLYNKICKERKLIDG